MKICSVCKIEHPLDNYHIQHKNKNNKIRLNNRCKSCVSLINKQRRDKKHGYLNPFNEGHYTKNCTLHGRLSHENTLIKIRRRKNNTFTASAHCFICIKIKYRDDCIPNTANEYDKKYSHERINDGNVFCYKCKLTKTINEFRKCDLNVRYCLCKQCHKQYRIIQEKKAALKRKYNLSLEEYEIMKLNQNYLCKICGKPETKTHNASNTLIDLSVDHCHETGKIRGLLCSSCNIGIGYLKHSSELLRKAAIYMDAYE